MSEQATLKSIARSGHRKNVALICRVPHTCSKPFQACFRSGITISAPPEPVRDLAKQARYRERHLAADGEKVRVGLNLNAAARPKLGRFARH